MASRTSAGVEAQGMTPTEVLQALLEPSSFAVIGTAVLTVYLSALRALECERFLGKPSREDITVMLNGWMALAIPVIASAFLVLMFFFFSSISQIFTLLACAVSGVSVVFAFAPLAEAAWRAAGLSLETDDKAPESATLMEMTRRNPHLKILAVAAAAIVVGWLFTGHWVLNNILGCSLCAFAVSFVRLPNMKVCALLLGCVLVYDIFWVFFSDRFFGSNVMLRVAEQKAYNPIRAAADALNLTAPEAMAKSLDPPVKIMFPAALLSTHPENFTILGLGDMALPGMLVSLGASFDQKWCRTEPTSAARLKARGGAPAIQYLRRATAGYAVGLVSAMVGGMISGAAQPALMYLVPAVLATVLFTAWQKRELPEVWGGQRPRLCSCCPYPGKISAATKEEEGKV